MTALQLKNSILQMAIEGKLVEQNPGDEPVCVAPYEGETPFDVPESWTWTKLENVSERIHYGYTASAATSGNARLLRITDIQENKVDWSSVPFCQVTEREAQTYSLHNRDIVIARTGGTIGKSYIVRGLDEPSVFASYLIRVILLTTINEEYLKYFMESPLYWTQLKDNTMGTGQPNVNGRALSALMLPVPPLSEQHRIVEKLEELLPHIAEYDAAEKHLTVLNDNFPATLKKSILQAAVQGKLTEQDYSEPPVDVSPYEGEVPYEVPENWVWVMLGDVCKIFDIDHKMPAAQTEGIPFISPRDFTDVGIDFDNAKKISRTDFEKLSRKGKVERGDIIFPRYGTIGVVRKVQVNFDFLVSYSCATIKPNREILDENYIFYALQTPHIESEIKQYINKTTQPNVGLKSIQRFVAPVPPLSEQRSIVAAIEATFEQLSVLDS